MIRMERRRSTGGGYDFSQRYGGKKGAENVSLGSTPLQLANLSVLISNLEKTGNFVQANEEAFQMNQKKRYTSLNKL